MTDVKLDSRSKMDPKFGSDKHRYACDDKMRAPTKEARGDKDLSREAPFPFFLSVRKKLRLNKIAWKYIQNINEFLPT